MAKRPMKMRAGRAGKAAPPGPDFDLLGGLKAAAPKRGTPKPPRTSAAGYRGMKGMKGMMS